MSSIGVIAKLVPQLFSLGVEIIRSSKKNEAMGAKELESLRGKVSELRQQRDEQLRERFQSDRAG